MRQIDVEGKTVQQAVSKGLKELGLSRDQAEVVVLEEGKGGFLGLGSKKAKVRLSEKLWKAPETSRASERTRSRPENSPASGTEGGVDSKKAEQTAEEVLKEILKWMDFGGAPVHVEWQAGQGRVRAEIHSEQGAILIGGDGRTLEALQFLTTLIVSQRMKAEVAVQVDCQGYWKRQEDRILEQVQKAVEQVKRAGRPYRMDPMNPVFRRLVHKTLQGHPEVETFSEGEGQWRKIVLKPRGRK